jgi:hypothetical protein
MRRKDLSVWAVVLLAVALALSFAAGCGGDEGTSAPADDVNASPTAAEELTPQEIVDQSTEVMNGINSAAFTADLKLDLEGDASKMSDPTAQQLLSKPITLHVEGSSSTKPQASAMDVTVALMGQNLSMTVLSADKKAWVQYENAWYAVPQENTKALQSSDSGALPTDQLDDLGLDPQKWEVEWELAGTETVDGAEVYHLTASPNPKTIAGDVMKALSDPDLYEKLGDPETAQQFKSMKSQNAKELKQLQQALETVEVELWIETESMYLRKGTVLIGMDTKGMEGAEGLTAMNVDVAFTMADFDEPVEVKAPSKAKDFDTLMNKLVGGMM